MEFTRKDLERMILEQFEINQITPIINSQIGKMITERGYSYKDIARALVFFVEIEKGTYDPKYGIGIVPFVMDRAQAFFERKRIEKKKQLENLKQNKDKPIIILKPQKLKKKKKLDKINLEDLED